MQRDGDSSGLLLARPDTMFPSEPMRMRGYLPRACLRKLSNRMPRPSLRSILDAIPVPKNPVS